jgi:hypothetical protein
MIPAKKESLKMIDADTVMVTARSLLSESGEAPEYDRGVVNLVAELLPVEGQPVDERMSDVEAKLRE